MKSVFFTILFLISVSVCQAQGWHYETTPTKTSSSTSSSENETVSVKQKKSFDPSKLTFGGGFGVGFGSNNYFGFSLSPQVGYRFSKKFEAGLGLSYSYSKENSDTWIDYEGNSTEWKYTRNYGGLNLYANYYPIDWIILTVRPEIIRMWETTKVTTNREEHKYNENKFVPAVTIGAGVRFKPFSFTLNYDLVQNDNSPYGDNIYFGIGLWF
ncbi:MAG: hypothetical protein ACLVKO_09890 [Dysgonomonas sp.]